MRKKDFDKLATLTSALSGEKIIGFIGGVPVVERKDVPKGVVYAINMKQFVISKPLWGEKLKMKREKVLLYNIHPVTISYITGELAEYTKYNGCYPDFIDMPEDVWNDFQRITTGDGWRTFRGIPVRKVEHDNT